MKDDVAPQAAGSVINTKGMAAHVLELADQPTVSSFTPTVENIEIDEPVMQRLTEDEPRHRDQDRTHGENLRVRRDGGARLSAHLFS